MSTDALSLSGVELTWEPEHQLATLRFTRRRHRVRRGDAEQCVRRLREWVGREGEPWLGLVDCGNLRDADSGWRSVWTSELRAQRDRSRVAWFNASAGIRLAVVLFVRTNRLDGRVFATEEDARAWLLAGTRD